MTTDATVDVTQADREAAASLAHYSFTREDILSGAKDAAKPVQAFARHRQQAERDTIAGGGARENDKPPSHWSPDPRYDRRPQTVQAWDWRQDGASADDTFERSRDRLNFAYCHADPHAPDQMALVLRVDIGRILARLTHYTAHRELLMANEAAALATPAPGVGLREAFEAGWLASYAGKAFDVALNEHLAALSRQSPPQEPQS